jgi:hypothetical protein
MKSAAFLISLIVLPVALPAHAKDRDDLSSWSLEDLCERKVKPRYTEGILAEIERRGIFSEFEFDLIREGRVARGMGEDALHCAWGQPRRTEVHDGESWLVYYYREYDLQWRYLVRLDSSMVAGIREDIPPSAAFSSYDTLRRRQFGTNGSWVVEVH